MNRPIIANGASPAVIALLDAFGLHQVPSTRLVLTLEVDKPVMLEVTSQVQDGDLDDVIPVLKRYAWVEQDDPYEPPDRPCDMKIRNGDGSVVFGGQ